MSNLLLSFLSNALIPEEKAFNVLSGEHQKKLIEIFNDIDFDDLKAIDLHKAVRFNKYIQENIAEAKAEKDANDFLKSTAICNKHSVNIDEWLFSFSKLFVCDADEFNKFLEDYEAAVAVQGKLKAINIWSIEFRSFIIKIKMIRVANLLRRALFPGVNNEGRS